jgi:hypothetical protein
VRAKDCDAKRHYRGKSLGLKGNQIRTRGFCAPWKSVLSLFHSRSPMADMQGQDKEEIKIARLAMRATAATGAAICRSDPPVGEGLKRTLRQAPAPQ